MLIMAHYDHPKNKAIRNEGIYSIIDITENIAHTVVTSCTYKLL